ncbi:MAG: cbb3-type cytochrome oxidase assembly protein CcoS [Planctomycetota bacterium]
MSVIFVMLPVALLLAGAAVAAFVWASQGGQLDDVDTPPKRMLFEDTPAKRDPPAEQSE